MRILKAGILEFKTITEQRGLKSEKKERRRGADILTDMVKR